MNIVKQVYKHYNMQLCSEIQQKVQIKYYFLFRELKIYEESEKVWAGMD